MATITFTPQLRRFLEVPDVTSSAPTLRAALDDVFAANPRLRGYLLDDQGHLRANVVAFVDGRRSDDRIAMADRVQPDSQVFVMQALSGG